MDQSRLEALMVENATFLARLNSHLQATIPLYVEEYVTSPTVAEATTNTLVLPAGRDTYFKCTGIYVSVPFGTTSATLQLGSQFLLPIQNTTTILTPVQRILESRDVRTLTFTTGSDNGGVAFIYLWGEAIPKYGKL